MNHPSKTFLRLGISVGTAVFLFLALFAALNVTVLAAPDDNTYQVLPFSQDWTDTSLITVNDDWSGVYGIIGYLGDGFSGTNPQTIVTEGTGTTDAIANHTDPNTLSSGGVAEFEITNPVVALQGSGTADAPFILIHLNTTGESNIQVAYNLRDIDGSADNAVQPVALQYRVGSTGDFTNLPDGFVADATTGPNLATLVTPVTVTLPAEADNQPEVQVRIITANASGSDEWVGIDDISITSDSADPKLSIGKTVSPNTDVPYQSAVTYTVVLENGTAVDETAVLFTDTLPVSTTVASWVEQPDGASETGGEITWTGTVTAGESITFTFTANQTADYSETITNTAEFSGTVAGTAQAGFTVEDEPLLVDLVVEKTGPTTGVAGETINYTVVISNDGNLEATSVLFTDTFPAEISFVSDDSGLSHTSPSANIYVWDIGNLASKTAVSINLTGTITNNIATTTLVTNTAKVSTSSIDDNTANNSAEFETTLTPFVTIHDIQFTTDVSGDSPYKNQTVTTEGIVTANFGKQVFIQDGAGAWNGVMLYQPNGSLAIGDYVRVTGKVTEYFNLTEFTAGAQTTVISTSNSLPAFEGLATSDVSTEPYEGVLVQVNNVNVSNEDLGFGEWAVDDGSGNVVVNDLGSYTYVPTNNDLLHFVRGPLNYDFGAFKIEPRNDGDIAEGISIEKTAPNLVAPGGLFTYTITVKNQIGFDLTNVVISDVVPANTTFAYALDGGVESGGTVTWNIANLAHASNVSVQFAVTATNSIGKVVNDTYAVYASNHITPVTNLPTTTFVDTQLHIYQIQGEGLVSPIVGQEVTVSGEVVADFQGNTGMRGFFIQDPAGDGNMLTSDGIFVYDYFLSPGVDVNVGDMITVTGKAAEYQNNTQISNVSAIVTETNTLSIAPTVVTLPETTNGDLERYEGMFVTLPQTMTVAQNYFQGQFGQVSLSANGRLYQPTNVYTPTSPEAVDLADSNARNLIVLDDASTVRNPNPVPYIGISGTLRAGDTTTDLIGILDEGSISSQSVYDYRLQPLSAVTFNRVNKRSNVPEAVGGRLQIASFNVLNYFTTIGSSEICGPSQDLECRGADTADEFVRQRTKIITAIVSIDAEIVGLMEIENNEIAAIMDLVDGLNAEAGAGTYAFIDTGYIGGDAIKVAMIYQPAKVTPVGTTAVLTDVFPFDTNTRPPLAQAFVENETGHEFIVVVNHFKSKGSACDGDPDLGDGQGECNLTRVQAANELVAWLNTDPTGTGDPDIFIIGDLNSYAQEDPITALKGHGYTNLIEQFTGTWAYSYVFDGQSGYLDHALATSSAQASVTGVTEWHINADEPSALDYNNYNPDYLFQPDAFRASDHDPVLIGVSLKWITYMPIVFK